MPFVFQYGSNCDEPRLNDATRLNGRAKDVRRARTVGSYEIAFNKWSEQNHCAAADLIGRRNGSPAWGVLYEVSPADLKKLEDDIEGPSYKPKRLSVRDARGARRIVTTFAPSGQLSARIHGL
jgi:cation transport regulator ChaC